jgi:Contractile injection system tape measure protein
MFTSYVFLQFYDRTHHAPEHYHNIITHEIITTPLRRLLVDCAGGCLSLSTLLGLIALSNHSPHQVYTKQCTALLSKSIIQYCCNFYKIFFMDSRHHKIRRQFLNLEFNGTEAEVVALQCRLPDICDQFILPAVEKAFNRLALHDTILTIDRLEIDAGIVTINKLEFELSEKITQALENSLRELSVSGYPASSRVSGNITSKTKGECLCEAVIFFLKNGTLPWSFHLSGGSSFEEIVQHFLREPETFECTPEFIRREFVGALSSAAARKRLVYQFTPVFLDTLLALMSPEKSKVLRSYLQLNPGSEALLMNEVKQRERLLWESAFASLASGSPFTEQMIVAQTQAVHSEAMDIGESFIYFLKNGTLPWSFHPFSDSSFEEMVQQFLEASQTSESIHELIRDVLTSVTARTRLINQFTPVFLETLLELISPEDKKVLDGCLQLFRSSEVLSLDAKQLQPLLWEHAFASLASGRPLTEKTILTEIRSVLSASELRNSSSGNQIQSVLFDELLLTEQNVWVKDESASPSPVEHPDAQSGIYPGLAGLVLLHPFLPQLFRALGIADDETLLQPNKALYLLYFLATGESYAPEYELVLPKIMCNISLETVVESDIIITVDEQEEAEALLSAVIRHWEILKNTSIEGLRETFLKRSGKLSRYHNEWLLQVESKSYDILLEQLPWGISMIKLPWMSQMLRVEWI